MVCCLRRGRLPRDEGAFRRGQRVESLRAQQQQQQQEARGTDGVLRYG